EIELWNIKYKLVGARGEELIVRHILDSLSAIPELNKLSFSTAADVGSGAGLPGIPLSIFYPEVKFSLIERSGRRSGFLRNVISLLKMGDRLQVIESELEEVSKSYDLVLFRAFRKLTDYYSELERITSPKGFLFAYKGKLMSIEQEMTGLNRKVTTQIIPVNVPFLDEERNFIIFTQLYPGKT
ncbi:MAG: 16S rRNA (guanine(527)-N(7))-methyltransferase RsmG, partial [Spirochaetaceae bacterium]|nr:16S rRNA (guanine(527)-N(7))-methyltransferase RsmG [Spirochaetaceae bacterium]